MYRDNCTNRPLVRFRTCVMPTRNPSLFRALVLTAVTALAVPSGESLSQEPVQKKPAGDPVAQPATDGTSIADLLAWTEGLEWKSRGIDWEASLDGRPSAAGLTLRPGQCLRYPLPGVIQGDYDLEVEFTRRTGDDGISIFFPVGPHQVQLELGLKDGSRDLLGWIDGQRFNGNPTIRSPSVITENDHIYAVKVRVRLTGPSARIEVDVDNHANYITWEGPSSRLLNREHGGWKLTMADHVWVGALHSRVEFRKVRVHSVNGSVERDTLSEVDRAQDLREGFVRLTELEARSPQTGWGAFGISQMPLDCVGEDIEQRWPLVTREPRFSTSYFGVPATSRLGSSIPNSARSFSVISYNESSRTARFRVAIDGKDVAATSDSAVTVIKVDIPPKAALLELFVDPLGNAAFDHTYWCSPRYHGVAADRITDKMLDGTSSQLRFAITSSSVPPESISRNQPLSQLRTGPLNFRDVKPCHEFLYAHAPSSLTYVVPPGMNRLTAVGYNVLSHHARFEVWADGKRHYQSEPAGIVSIDVRLPAGTRVIDLRVSDLGDSHFDGALWCYPRLHRN